MGNYDAFFSNVRVKIYAETFPFTTFSCDVISENILLHSITKQHFRHQFSPHTRCLLRHMLLFHSSFIYFCLVLDEANAVEAQISHRTYPGGEQGDPEEHGG